MKKTIAPLLFIVMILITACSPAQKASNLIATPGGVIPEVVSAFDIQELGVGEKGWVALTNFTGQPGNLAGLYLCQGQACFALPAESIPAGETVRISNGSGAGVEHVIAKNGTFGELRSADGEIALTTSENPQQPEQILFYMQWGSTPHELTSLAIDAGLWLEGGYAPTSEKASRLYRVKETGLWLFEE